MNLIIHELRIEGFKGSGKQSWTFGQRVRITGENYTGKTSIAEAIVYGLTGLNLDGSPRTDGLIPLGAKKALVQVGFFGVDGQVHTVQRKRDDGKGNKIALDGAKASQTQVDRILGLSEAFLACFWPASLGAMKDTDARNFFLKIVRPPTWDQVLAELTEPERQMLAPYKSRMSIEEVQEEIRHDLREIEDETKRNEGARQAYQDTLRQKAPEAIDTTAMEADLSSLQEELAKLNVAPRIIDTEPFTQQLKACKLKYEALEAQIPTYTIEPGTQCPTCKQPVTAEHVAAVKAEIEQIAAGIREQQKAVLAEGARAKAEREVAQAENQRIQHEYFTTGHDHRVEVTNRIQELKMSIQDANRQNAQRNQIIEAAERARVKLAELEAGNKQDAVTGKRLQAELDATKQFVTKRAELIAEDLNKGLNRASIQLFDIVKTTGELKPVFRMLYDKKPFGVLSTSERVRLGLEIAGLVKRLTGIEYPTFIDCAESITHFDAPPGQLFVARVVEGQELTVTNEGGIEDEQPTAASA